MCFPVVKAFQLKLSVKDQRSVLLHTVLVSIYLAVVLPIVVLGSALCM